MHTDSAEEQNMLRSLRRIRLLPLSVLLAIGLLSRFADAAEAPQKLRVAYAAITAAFSLPWIAKEAGLFQRHGLDVELVYIASGARAVQTLVGGSIDVAEIGGPAGGGAKLAGAETTYVGDPGEQSHRFYRGSAADPAGGGSARQEHRRHACRHGHGFFYACLPAPEWA